MNEESKQNITKTLEQIDTLLSLKREIDMEEIIPKKLKESIQLINNIVEKFRYIIELEHKANDDAPFKDRALHKMEVLYVSENVLSEIKLLNTLL